MYDIHIKEKNEYGRQGEITYHSPQDVSVYVISLTLLSESEKKKESIL
jgi:lipoate-protein ligase B